ncbi:MAG: hypothetical protein A3B91_05030 [Candidatus Yanofskybacteria bacterium RIFCSPHIGHO2_02_FULL_41_29]|uniref:Uncharacterized protein n=1 Tax=Candidatus Yanofskybacteria bacterium RIFCSPHIGHO2_01_FULL_41_53 TaxID=1802663 RepID=A0A1F8EIM2_9BACT|nr:MAG: hypothetical protein A2650_04030 [Candidatus Yanofskybacteria bacterium RIFCSPHIGHO2_01_FULL_41_53]OGN11659.1 MAG: hypothetical protein A3B91_05030 [Candidatus Yanofskybacteria bacterium RIFCSPHIGHO2_02_FULL_41_29]OGN23419.1 MAG: hypothetical protein A2916_03420 [Candidatus Yanofskybacteria bacterium RIFCSPLOWO2_01_FULL_41_67]
MEKVERKLIAKEIELGFLSVPTSFRKNLPKDKTRLSFSLDDKVKELAYNPLYGRVFGLTDYYRKNNASPKDIVDIEKSGDNQFRLTFHKTTEQVKKLESITTDEAKELIDVSELSSQVKGNIVEERIGHLILLYGQGLLNVYKPISDIEGIDLIVVKKGIFQPVFIQVKGRYNLRGKDNLQIGVSTKSFEAHHTFYVVGAYFDPQKMDLHEYLVFIPSTTFKKSAVIVNRGKVNEKYVLTSPLSPGYSGKYSDFIIKKENLVNEIFDKFREIEQYLK